jgi:predicted ferric reductase
MRLVTKCIFWFGLYLFLVTCPMGVAAMTVPRGGSAALSVNLAIGLGFVALGVMALEMALVSRLDAASGAFGLDVLFQFHRGVGIASVALVFIHPLLLVAGGSYPVAVLGLGGGVPMSIRLGTLAAILAFVLVISSVLRRRLGMPYEVWRPSMSRGWGVLPRGCPCASWVVCCSWSSWRSSFAIDWCGR